MRFLVHKKEELLEWWDLVIMQELEIQMIENIDAALPHFQAIAEVLGKVICDSLVEMTKNYSKSDEISNCVKILADRLAEKSAEKDKLSKRHQEILEFIEVGVLYST